MAKFQVIFTRVVTETQELTISAKNQEEAGEKAQAKIDDGKLKEKAWETQEEEIDFEISED